MRNRLPIVLAVLAAAIPLSCRAGAPLGEPEKRLIADLKFDEALMSGLRADKLSEFKRLSRSIFLLQGEGKGVKEETSAREGLEFEVGKGRGRSVASKHAARFRERGYSIFVSDDAFGRGNDAVAVIKSADQFDIVVAMGTDGINYDIDNAAVVAKLKEWNARRPFEIVGAGMDWMEARFAGRPADMASFAEEVYRFCPDVVDQGTGTTEALAAEMERTNTLYLWWD